MSEPATRDPQRFPGWREGYGDGYRGGPNRTSPRRSPRAMVATALSAAAIAAMVAAEPGSRWDRSIARPRTKVTAIHSTLPIPAHLKGTLHEITAEAGLDSCKAQGLSYAALAYRLARDPRTIVNHVAELESWGVVRTERCPSFTEAGSVFFYPNNFFVQIPPWIEPPWIESPPASSTPSNGPPPASSATVDAVSPPTPKAPALPVVNSAPASSPAAGAPLSPEELKAAIQRCNETAVGAFLAQQGAAFFGLPPDTAAKTWEAAAREKRSLAQALQGIEDARDKAGGKKGHQLAALVISYAKSTRNGRPPSLPVKAAVRAAEEQIAALRARSSTPAPRPAAPSSAGVPMPAELRTWSGSGPGPPRRT